MCILTTSFATENTCIFFWFQEASLLANVGVIKIIKAFDVPHIIQCAAIARECKKVVMNFKALSSSVPSHYDSSHCLRFHFLWVRRFLHYLGGKLAPSFCRINDVVPFTCQFWNRKVFFFPWNFPSLGTIFSRAHVDISSTVPRGIRFETHLSLNAVWHHYLATDSRKRAESSAMKNKDVFVCKRQ